MEAGKVSLKVATVERSLRFRNQRDVIRKKQ